MKTLKCEMDLNCKNKVTHLDEKGFIYCKAHGQIRKRLMRCRALKPKELKQLKLGQTLERY